MDTKPGYKTTEFWVSLLATRQPRHAAPRLVVSPRARGIAQGMDKRSGHGLPQWHRQAGAEASR